MAFMIAKPRTSSLKLIIGILQRNLKTCAFCAYFDHFASTADLPLADALRNGCDPGVIDAAGRVIENDIDERALLDDLETILRKHSNQGDLVLDDELRTGPRQPASRHQFKFREHGPERDDMEAHRMTIIAGPHYSVVLGFHSRGGFRKYPHNNFFDCG